MPTSARKLPRARPAPSPAASELDSLLAKARYDALAARIGTSEISSRLQEVIDHIDVTRPLINYIPQEELEPLGSIWSGLADRISLLRASVDDAYADTDLVSGTASLTSASTTSVISHSVGFRFDDEQLNQAWNDYITVTSRPDLNDEVRSLMRLFALDIAPAGQKSPLELFDIAHAASSAPVSGGNPASTSLLPMRDGIQGALTHLLLRRPTAEHTGSSERAKLKSIATQLRKAGVGDEIVEGWVDEWHRLNDKDLSGSKRADISRREWGSRLVAATRFLHSLLTQLDPSKLRG